MVGLRLLLSVALALVVLGVPASVAAGAGSAPTEVCVPGTVWEDPASGVKYLCIYDEAFGGPRWVLLSGGQRGSAGMPFRSTIDGCLHLAVGLSALSGGGADAIVRSYRWPCTSGYRVAQPTGELRSRVVIQRYGSSGWSTCRDTGYLYNTIPASGWVAGVDTGTACASSRRVASALAGCDTAYDRARAEAAAPFEAAFVTKHRASLEAIGAQIRAAEAALPSLPP